MRRTESWFARWHELLMVLALIAMVGLVALAVWAFVAAT
ncbi:MAG: hypothetical protein UY92_C0003G0029 [Candidatus Magasanikbacteria bacterium GW2011_GWA2_56_11]|uniref:Uncharacterized protein n=1 Tax=Candidatus Magasanikbacteria bacterium GW2011_GWA2_56_11 TaxID=1619044 RepID=A0A0G1YHA7_9BACT|nr:MAG: hypothetical protein UY92_C0003G0029 [Candidatus Magasanikbacteria bacterium GW2011_GWA2_56_11]